MTRHQSQNPDSRNDYGCSALEWLGDVGFPLEQLEVIHEYDQFNSLVEQFAAENDIDETDLNGALQARYGFKPSRVAPVFRLLIDVYAKVQFLSVSSDSSPMSDFLDEATSPDNVHLGVCPMTLRVAKSLLDQHPDIQTWANKRHVKIDNPSSGAEGGALQARLWNQALGCNADNKPWWCGEFPLSAEMLSSVISAVLTALNNWPKSRDGHYSCKAGIDPERVYFLREGLMAFEKGDEFRRWRDARRC